MVILSDSYICCDEKWLEVISFWVTVVSLVLYFELEGVIEDIYCSICHILEYFMLFGACAIKI